jgi:hypothetical protein
MLIWSFISPQSDGKERYKENDYRACMHMEKKFKIINQHGKYMNPAAQQ